MTPAYEDAALNPDGVSQNAPGGGFMWDGRAATLADQAALPLLSPLEMNNASKAAVVRAVQHSSYAALFQQAFGTGVFNDNGNCAACHYPGANFNGTVALMTDFTYQALGVPRQR